MIDRSDSQWIADERAYGANYANFRARFRAVEAAKSSGDTLIIEEPIEGVWKVVRDGQVWNWNSESDAQEFLRGAPERTNLEREVRERDEEIERLRGELQAARNEILRLRAMEAHRAESRQP